MDERPTNPAPPAPPDKSDERPPPLPAPVTPKRRRWLRWILIPLLSVVVLLAAARPFMPMAIRWYVNRTLDRSELYQGKIGDVSVHLWRGAYAIHDVQLLKVTGNVPVPLYSAKRVDFQLEWSALLHRRLVGRILMEEPELNFVDADNPQESQTGSGGPWLQIIRDLFPFKINSAEVREGSIHFRTFQKAQPVDVYLSHLHATVDDLTNIADQTTSMITTVKATALAMDQAKFQYEMKLDPFSYRPTFHVAARLIGLDVTQTNNLARAYGAFDFKRGWFDLVVEIDAKEGQIQGYIKPLFRDLKIFSLTQDIREQDVLGFFWQALVGTAAALLKNQPRNQLATLIPFRADASGATTTDMLATLGNVLRNAFIRAYLPRLERGALDTQDIQFDPPEITDPITPGESP
jgi:hypothetical protein